jgi:predicted DCC family thiol-disulfide oxidoreductase YuxK
MHVVDGTGRVARGFRAWRRIAREVPLLLPVWPFLWLPGVAPIGDRVYSWVAAHRQAISRRLGFDACCAACARPAGPGESR